MAGSSDATKEIEVGERFAFGDNWRSFLGTVDEEKIKSSQAALQVLFGAKSLSGRTFVDVGSGSGLSSLAAHRLGAKVVSFDFDPQSVKCTEFLRERFVGTGNDWRITQGSVLDQEFLSSLGTFDIVYSWGVLHHTGHMWEALRNVELLAAESAQLCVAIYNDQGPMSAAWRVVKSRYVRGSKPTKRAIEMGSYAFLGLPSFANRMLFGGPATPRRGMDRRRDLVDWVGGYPFEVAKPEKIFSFYAANGWRLEYLTTTGGRIGCNEFVFSR